MNILVCGSRDYSNSTKLYETLDLLTKDMDRSSLVIIHGGALGADSLANQWAFNRKIKRKCYFANWHLYGKRAGPIRNQQMLDEGKPDLVIAFSKCIPMSPGTVDMVTRSKAAGVKVTEVEP